MKYTIRLFQLFLLLNSLIHSQSIVDNTSNIVAEKLFNENKYDLAIIEFFRINTLFPDNNNFIHNQSRIAEAYKNKGLYIESINEYKKVLRLDKNHWNSVFQISSLLQSMLHFYESNAFIIDHVQNFQGVKLDSLFYLRGTNEFGLMDVDSAKHFFTLIKDEKLQVEARKALNAIEKYQDKQHHSPKMAKYLNAVFPGLGYFYLGLIQTSLATMSVEAIFLYSTLATYNNGYSFGSLMSGLFFTGFYAGSIYGAEQFAHKLNKNSHKKVFIGIKLQN